jgi:hypothetical protein
MDSEAGRVELLGVEHDDGPGALLPISCPACGALPCDWVNNPLVPDNGLREALEELRHRAWNMYQTCEFGDMDFENAIAGANRALSALQPNTGERHDG